ncbi:MAG: alpha-L-rhamnosidase [Acidimicrobiaceae bacterium]|nr:alpha-L-rhamnosidase [Acidimicrobiaceae bacterium]
MGEPAEGQPLPTWTLTRRQLLGGGVMGVAGLALASVVPAATDAAEPPPGVTGKSRVPSAPGAPNELAVDGLAVPIGLSPGDVYFAWQVRDARRGASQSAYRIQVSGPVVGPGPAPMAWDSGQVSSGEQAFVVYGGPRLASDSAYRWTVRTWDHSGNSGPSSPPSVFETGLGDRDWRASWIGRAKTALAEPDQYTYARTEATLRRASIVRARAYVSGDQQYELYVNGTRAGKGQAYSYPDSMYYETLDVTGLLRPQAANAVGIVSNWQGPTKGHPAGRPGVIVQIVVHYSDGHVQLITTDGSWRVRKGAWLPGRQRDLEGDLVDFTENIDGPDQPVGWDMPGFDDRLWSPAVVLGRAHTKPWTHLVSVRTRIVEEPVRPVSLTTLSSGAVVADFGKVYAAVPTVAFHQGVPGRVVTMRAGYLLDEPVAGQPFTGVPGQVSTEHGTQHTDMSYSYVQRGGAEQFHPFDYLGFRYFQIDDPGEELAPEDVMARARHTALPRQPAANFSSDEPIIDAEFELGLHSAMFTAQEQFLDTPTREKGPWLFDGFNESCTAMATLGEQNLSRKSLVEFGQSQSRYWPNGAVNKIYPTGLGALDINESTEIYAEWVWQYWMHTGDRALLASVYGVLRRIADYVERAVSPRTGLVRSLPATNVYYDYPVVTRLNVLGVNVFRRTADVAEALQRPVSEVVTQRRRQAALTAAVNRRLSRADGTYVDGLKSDGTPTPTASQTANACAAFYDVVPARNLGVVARYVSSLGMQAPPQLAAEVLGTMALAGLHADLVTRLTDASTDGWANILARGATFTWEVWNPSDLIGDSMSHGWGSNVAVQIQRSLLGVRPTAPGFASFDVTPPSEGLSRASGSVPTPRGTIALAWSRPTASDPHFSLDLLVPPNSTATLSVPANQVGVITESGGPVDRATGIRLVRVADGVAHLETGAGAYSLRSAPTA